MAVAIPLSPFRLFDPSPRCLFVRRSGSNSVTVFVCCLLPVLCSSNYIPPHVLSWILRNAGSCESVPSDDVVHTGPSFYPTYVLFNIVLLQISFSDAIGHRWRLLMSYFCAGLFVLPRAVLPRIGRFSIVLDYQYYKSIDSVFEIPSWSISMAFSVLPACCMVSPLGERVWYK